MTNSARRVLSALATLPLAAALLALVPGRASADPDCSRRVLNVVAHHDDDMFFLSPDLISDLTDPTVCVRTLFLVASNYGDDPLTYAEDREQGIRDAYAVAAGPDAGTWQRSAYTAGGFTATRYTLGDRISIVESRLPDNASDAVPDRGKLWDLYATDTRITALAGEEYTETQDLDRASLRSFLRTVGTDFQPDVINTVDPTADLHPRQPLPLYDGTMRFHPDHVTTARMVMWTFPDVPIQFYRDYTTLYAPENVTDPALSQWLTVFAAYDAWDDRITLCNPRPAGAGCGDGYHWDWLRRQYRADWSWTRDLVVPLPPSDRPGPYLGRTYRLENVATGLSMTVGTADEGEMVRVWGDTGSDGQRWRTNVVQTGWQLVNESSHLCLTVGALVVQGSCDAEDTTQVFTMERGFLGGLTLRPTSDTAQQYLLQSYGSPGASISLQPGHNSSQEWRAVPVS